MSTPQKPVVDWVPLLAFSDNELECGCGYIYRGHAKYVLNHGIVPMINCPGCGRWDHIRRASSDPERFTLRDDA